MSRVFGVMVNAAIDRNITNPRYLISLELEEQMNLSTWGDILIGDTLWAQGQIEKLGVSELTATLSLHNPDRIFSAPAFRGDYMFRPVEILWAYPQAGEPLSSYFPPGYLAFPESEYIEFADVLPFITVFSGYISDITKIDEYIDITFTRNSERRYPSVRIRPPLANHLPGAGEVLTWKDQTHRMEE